MRISDPKQWYEAIHRLDSDILFARGNEVVYADEHAAELVRLILAHPVTRRMVDDQLMIDSIASNSVSNWSKSNA